MKALLLGPNGQFGHDIRRAHAEAGEPFDLVPLARDRLDVAAPRTVERLLGELEFDALVNCTGYHKTDEVEGNANLGFNVNAHAVRAMARACAAKRASFIHVSTDYVFGGAADRRLPLREDGVDMQPQSGRRRARKRTSRRGASQAAPGDDRFPRPLRSRPAQDPKLIDRFRCGGL